MDFKCYLAMTATEFIKSDQLPKYPAWMACHYASYATGISNLPQSVPPNTMLIMNDRIPPCGNEPHRILAQIRDFVEENNIDTVLLDFQRQDIPENHSVVEVLTEGLPCPVGVSEGYAANNTCPVFVRCPTPHSSLSASISGWQGREIWLELATETESVYINKDGSTFSALPHADLNDPFFTDTLLHSRYHTEVYTDHALFTLQRTTADLKAILHEAESMGVTLAIGLHQQLGCNFPDIL